MDHGGRHLYHVSVDPLREVRKTLHITILSLEYKFTCMVNASNCLFGSEVPSYHSMFMGFQVKPVRYVVLQALKYWTILRTLPDTPNPSETGSSLKGALSYVVEYRGVHVRPSVGDLREEKYCSEGKDCYHGMITCLI
ncbi:hypothetical protein JHK87_057500 [Glycine soja]|nr:hypothetical protein JHK87_057500 [Glycine soja]